MQHVKIPFSLKNTSFLFYCCLFYSIFSLGFSLGWYPVQKNSFCLLICLIYFSPYYLLISFTSAMHGLRVFMNCRLLTMVVSWVANFSSMSFICLQKCINKIKWCWFWNLFNPMLLLKWRKFDLYHVFLTNQNQKICIRVIIWYY